MKISSVSKKVLASALSAAMVVAFAPTVALGDVAAGDTITVEFATEGLTLAQGSSEIASVTAEATSATAIALPTDTFTNHNYTKGTAEVTGWYWDANGNGKQDAGTSEATILVNASKPKLTINAADKDKIAQGSVITLKPVYAAATAEVTFDASTFAFSQKYDNGNLFVIPWTIASDVTATKRISLAKDGKEIAYYKLDQLLTAWNSSGLAFSVYDAEHKPAADEMNAKVLNTDLGKGSYSLTVTDVTTNKVVGAVDWKVVEVTANGIFEQVKGDTSAYKSGQTFLAVEGAELSAQLDAAEAQIDVFSKSDTSASKKTVKEYTVDGKTAAKVDGAGTGFDPASATVTKQVKVVDGMVLTPVYEYAKGVEFSYDPTGNGVLKADLNAQCADADADYVAIEYTYSVSGPVNASGTIKVSDGNKAIYDFGTPGAQAGVYTLTVTMVEKKGTNAEKTTVLPAQTVSIAKVTFDAGDYGTIAKTSAILDTTEKTTAYVAAGKAGAVVLNDKGTAAGATFVGWSLDGTKVVTSADAIAAGTTEVALKAVWRVAAQAYKPAYSFANNTLTLSTDKGAGYTVRYTTASVGTAADPTASSAKYTGVIAADPTKTASIKAKVFSPDGKDDSSVLVLSAYGTQGTSLKTWANSVLAPETSDSTKTAPKYYSTAYATAAADAKAAIEAKGYATATEWTQAVLEQQKTILKNVADYESAQIDALVAGVAQADGSVKKLDAATAASLKTKIAAVLTDVDYATDGKKETVPTVKILAGGTNALTNAATVSAVDALGTTATNGNAVVAAINGYADDAVAAAVTYKKADVDAAAAVTAQLKAAKTADEAEAALQAYANLTDTQKALVAVVDVKAAETIVAEGTSQALIDAQDEGTLNKIKATKKLTFTAKYKKTTKARSLTYTTKVSKSGNAVVYAKASGSSKITVAASGKVTLKKGAVKGKTYTAKVTATCGTQTRTVTAKFIVK